MLLIVFLIILHGIPTFIVLLLVRWILIKKDKKSIGNLILKTGSGLFLFYLISISAYNWSQTHHSYKLNISNTFDSELQVYEVPSFLDSPTELDLIIDYQNGTAIEFSAESDGDWFLVYLSKDEKYIWFESIGGHWDDILFNLETGEIMELDQFDELPIVAFPFFGLL